MTNNTVPFPASNTRTQAKVNQILADTFNVDNGTSETTTNNKTETIDATTNNKSETSDAALLNNTTDAPLKTTLARAQKKNAPARDSRGRLLPGHTANPKGRAPGSKNKRTSVRDALESIDFDFWEEWHSLYNDPETKNADRRGMLADILRYTHPQLKSVEVTQANPVPSITVHVVDAPANLNTSADLLDVIDAPDSNTASNT